MDGANAGKEQSRKGVANGPNAQLVAGGLLAEEADDIEKAIYLFTRDTVPGQGGDKRKFWQTLMGFESPTAIRAAILDSVTVADLVFQRQDQYGDRYQSVSRIQGETGVIWWVRTGWIVRSGESIARFVAAIPEKTGED